MASEILNNLLMTLRKYYKSPYSTGERIACIEVSNRQHMVALPDSALEIHKNTISSIALTRLANALQTASSCSFQALFTPDKSNTPHLDIQCSIKSIPIPHNLRVISGMKNTVNHLTAAGPHTSASSF